MKKLKSSIIPTLILITTLLIVSCNKDNDDNAINNSDKATVKIMLTDAPAVYNEVNIDIQEVRLHSESEGWINVPLENPGVYNLLAFSNGLDTLLGTCEIPEGTLSQIRLVLGSNNTIVVDSVSYPLTIPSGSESGLKLNLHQELSGGITYTFWLDFDAAQSIHQTGNGEYKLKPVIRIFAEGTTGSVEGYVFPAEAMPLVSLYNNEDTLMAIPDTTGYYRINGIAEGTYSVDFSSRLEVLPFATQTVLDIEVTNGETVELETITLLLP